MNIYLSLGVFFIGLALLARVRVTQFCRYLLRFPSWRTLGISEAAIAFVALLYLLSNPFWYEYSGSLTLVCLCCLALVEGGLIIVAEHRVRKATEYLLSHYYWFSVPIALFLGCLSICLLAFAYVGEVHRIDACQSDDHIEVVCGLTNPEDIVSTPDDAFLITPEFGGIGPYHALSERRDGRIMLTDIVSQTTTPMAVSYAANTWGDGACERTAAMPLSPQGIDLLARQDGAYQLAVINHAPFESIEMFEVAVVQDTWQLIWRGCVVVPSVNYLNDVSLAVDGSLYATHMYPPDFTLAEALAVGLFKYVTGYVLRWDPTNGFGQVPGSEGAHPNGVVYDANEELLYVAYTFGDRVAVIDMQKGAAIESLYMNSPDNLVLKEGWLWATSWDHEMLDMITCEDKMTCALPFSVYQIEPRTLRIEKQWRFNHTQMGMATVAFPLGNRIWLGGARSDRLGSFLSLAAKG